MSKQWHQRQGTLADNSSYATQGFPLAPSSVAEARAFVDATLTLWGMEDFSWSALQLVSELATNAVLHARTHFLVHVVSDEDGVRVGVQDFSPIVPAQRWYGQQSTTGRGLRMVASLANHWGVEGARDGKTIWFALKEEQPIPAHSWEDTEGAELESLLSQFESLEEGNTEAVSAPTVDLATIVARNLPVEVWAAAKQHMEELLREFELVVIAREFAAPEDVPERLLHLMDSLRLRYGSNSDQGDADLVVALEAGVRTLDHNVSFPASAKKETLQAVQELGDLLEASDEYCRKGKHLLTLATPPLLRTYRIWFLGQVTSQLHGEKPVPWSGPLS